MGRHTRICMLMVAAWLVTVCALAGFALARTGGWARCMAGLIRLWE